MILADRIWTQNAEEVVLTSQNPSSIFFGVTSVGNVRCGNMLPNVINGLSLVGFTLLCAVSPHNVS